MYGFDKIRYQALDVSKFSKYPEDCEILVRNIPIEFIDKYIDS